MPHFPSPLPLGATALMERPRKRDAGGDIVDFMPIGPPPPPPAAAHPRAAARARARAAAARQAARYTRLAQDRAYRDIRPADRSREARYSRGGYLNSIEQVCTDVTQVAGLAADQALRSFANGGSKQMGPMIRRADKSIPRLTGEARNELMRCIRQRIDRFSTMVRALKIQKNHYKRKIASPETRIARAEKTIEKARNVLARQPERARARRIGRPWPPERLKTVEQRDAERRARLEARIAGGTLFGF